MSIPEFKTADQVKTEAWERQHDKVLGDLIRLSDYALIHAKENAPEGGGFTTEASIQGFSVKITITPQPKVSGGWSKDGRGGAAQGPPKFDKAGVEAVIMANQDMLNYQEKDGKITISPKKFLGDLWAGINEDLKKYGMKWVSAGKESRWEGQP